MDALEVYLAELRPAPVNLVRAHVARRLCAAVADAPPYALPRLAAMLDQLLAELEGDEGTRLAHIERHLSWLRGAG